MIKKKFTLSNPSLQKELFGLTFKNPIGLGAGFDKNALYLGELEALGFGFVEVGTVTPLPQAGNDKLTFCMNNGSTAWYFDGII